jgi:DUF4097 and DUF4098 domain-containing protein YvlB
MKIALITSLTRWLTSTGTLLGVMVLSFAFLALPAFAQKAPKPAPKVYVGPVNETAQELADEYTDILEKLQDMVADYSDYLSDIGDKNLTAELSFERFNAAFKSSAYQDDPDLLETDLDAYMNKIDKLERECGQTDSKRNAKSCRVIRSLKRELNLIGEQLLTHQERLDETSYSHEQVRKAMKEALAGNKEITKQSLDIARKAMEQAAKELQRIDLTSPQAPQGVSTPTPPPVRSYTKTKKGLLTGHPTAAGTQRSANGVLTVTSMSLPVTISNPNGSIEITGTTGKTIEASLDFEISSSSRAREKELADAMGLQLSGERGGYRVDVSVPRLSDPQTQIVKNVLIVSVPAGLRLVCKSAYGDVTISGINGSVDATASFASLDISECSGGVTAANSMGSMSLSDCDGKIEAQNSYADIDISQCNGTIFITNAYAPVSVSDSRGQLTVHNSGEVTVSDHLGPVTINNQYGAVSVSDVKGNVEIQNAYQTISAERIDGQVYIENSYSPISVSSINGASKLVNRFSGINGDDLTGPFVVSTQNGDVELSLGHLLTGPCVINSWYGSVRLEVPKALNVLISAKTSNGDITSSYPIERTSSGLSKSGIVRLGSGRDSLSILGSNTEIDISGRH